MILVCYRCKRPYGEKEPFEDRRISHGLCDPCIPLEMARVEKELKAIISSPIGDRILQRSKGGRRETGGRV